MARQLIVIKLKSLWNTLRAQTALLVLAIIGYLYGAVMVGGLSVAMVFALAVHVPLIPELVVLTGALYTLGWLVLPVLLANQDATLDPIKLAPFIPPSRRLAWSLLLAGGAGIGGIYLAFFAISYIVGWWIGFGFLVGLGAFVGVGLAVFVSFVWSRVLVSFAARFQMGRRGRERAGLLSLVLMLVVLVPMGIWVGMFTANFSPSMLESVLRVFRWAPFGAPWALPWALAAGDYVQAAAFVCIALLTAWAGWWLWLRALPVAMSGSPTKLDAEAVALIETGETKLPGRRHRSTVAAPPTETTIPFLRDTRPLLRLGLSGPAAATAERTWLYWIRDPRLSAQLITILVLTAVALVMGKVTLEPDEATGASGDVGLGLLGMAAFLTGTTIGSLLQYDSTALWVQVSAGIRGWEERLGRVLGSLPIVAVLLVVSAGAFGALRGFTLLQTFAILTLLVVTCSSAATATGIISSEWIYQVQPPGASPLSAKQTGEFWATMLIGLGQFAFTAVFLLLPGAALLFGVVVFPGSWHTAAALVFSWVYSAAVVAFGIYVSGRILDRSQVELLTKMANWPGHRPQA